MASYDKYDPISGGSRAPLAVDWPKTDLGIPIGVGINANGDVVKGAGTTGIIGVLVLEYPWKAGYVVDIMRSGEIVDMKTTPGSVFYADVAGAVSKTATTAANTARIGHTVEGDRLIVSVKPA